MSFAAPSLANKRRFPNFFHTVPSDSAVNVALVRFLRQYGWSRVGTLTQREQTFIEVLLLTNLGQYEVYCELKTHILSKRYRGTLADNIQLSEVESFSEVPCDCVKKLKVCI